MAMSGRSVHPTTLFFSSRASLYNRQEKSVVRQVRIWDRAGIKPVTPGSAVRQSDILPTALRDTVNSA